MSLRDAFFKRGHEHNSKKKHHSNKDSDRRTPWRGKLGLQGVPPPMVPYPDGSMGPEPRALAEYERKYGKVEGHRYYSPAPESDTFDGRLPPHPHGPPMHFPSQPGPSSHDYMHSGPHGPSMHFPSHPGAYSDYHGSTSHHGPSMHFPSNPRPYSDYHGPTSHHGPSIHFPDNRGAPPHQLGQDNYSTQPRCGVSSTPSRTEQDRAGRNKVSERDHARPAAGHQPASTPHQAPPAQPHQPPPKPKSQPQPRQPTQPQFAQPLPRTGRVREGDQLPTGLVDPLATVSPKRPLGHHGMRQHVQGMTQMNPERHGKADDPMANYKVLEELAGLGGGKGRDSGRRRR